MEKVLLPKMTTNMQAHDLRLLPENVCEKKNQQHVWCPIFLLCSAKPVNRWTHMPCLVPIQCSVHHYVFGCVILGCGWIQLIPDHCESRSVELVFQHTILVVRLFSKALLNLISTTVLLADFLDAWQTTWYPGTSQQPTTNLPISDVWFTDHKLFYLQTTRSLCSAKQHLTLYYV